MSGLAGLVFGTTPQEPVNLALVSVVVVP